MKIDRVIFASNGNKNYLEFWPTVSKAWKSFGVTPTLIYADANDDGVNHDCGEVVKIPKIDGLNSAFIAQNSRLLAPALFDDEVCIISDIDNMPISKEYYFNPIKDLENDKFVIYRPNVCSSNQISIMWNAALGSTWGEIFKIKSLNDIINTLRYWYPANYKPFKGEGHADSTWFTDQVLLHKYVQYFKNENENRIFELNDNESGFYRLDRLCDDSKHSTSFDLNGNYSDFHMPRPYSQHKAAIDEVYNFYFKK
jgi:hypothetical protein